MTPFERLRAEARAILAFAEERYQRQLAECEAADLRAGRDRVAAISPPLARQCFPAITYDDDGALELTAVAA